MPLKYDAAQERSLMSELWDPRIANNLEAFVLFAFPWGKANTPLAGFQGPRAWQRDELQEVTAHIQAQQLNELVGFDLEVWRKATASGRGTGKSALVAWLALWFMTTRVGSSTIITANTEPQLKTKTFAELHKWAKMSINAHWFEAGVLNLRPAEWLKEALAEQLSIDSTYYYVQGLLWSEEEPDSFAGAHNLYGVQLMMDEGSGVPNSIFEVSEGFFTDLTLNRYWWVFSNPRRNAGGFYECFHKNKKFWRTRHLDSRTVEGIDQKRITSIIEQYGIDSDMVRIEVLGQFPHQGADQFISNKLVYAAQLRELPPQGDVMAALIMGVDVARFGTDFTVIRFRRGRDARSIEAERIKGYDNMKVANRCAELIDVWGPDAVCIDAGQGSGVIDRLRELKYKGIHEIWFGSEAEDKRWANKRTEMYARVRDWLPGGCIDTDPKLFSDLTAHEYYFFGKAQDQIMLKSKEEMKEVLGASPDDGDALALTFAVKVARRDKMSLQGARRMGGNRVQERRVLNGVDSSVFS